MLGAIALEEGADQNRDVVASLPERRHRDGHGVDPEIEVLPQMTVAQRDIGNLVGRTDEAEVDGHGLRGAETADHSLLEHAEELGLEVDRHLGDFVQEQ